jgi:hypothetical protein
LRFFIFTIPSALPKTIPFSLNQGIDTKNQSGERTMKPIMLISFQVLLLLAPPAIAETIYTWTDSEGKQYFSDKVPPDALSDYKTIETAPDSAGPSNVTPQRRPSYDFMVEKAKREALQSEKQRRIEAETRERQEKREAELQHKARIEPERRRLEKAIKAIENRALSPTFSMGMKKAQIKTLRQKLEKLENSSD